MSNLTEVELHWVVESAPSAFVMADAEGRIVLVNARTEKLFGYRRDEMIGQPVEMLIPEHFRSHHREDRQRYMKDPQTRPMGAGRDLSAKRKDGTEVPVEIGLSPIHTEKGTLVLASIVDISERKRAEQILRESEEQFRAFFESAAVGTVQVDASTGKFLRTNDRFRRMTGYPCGELPSLSFCEITHPEERARDQELFNRLLSGESTEYDMEKRYVRKDGKVIWVHVSAGVVRDAQGRPLHAAAIVQDITDRKQAEEALQAVLRSAERAKAAAEQANRTKDHFLAVLSHELRTPLAPVVLGVWLLEKRPDLDPKVREVLGMVRRNVEMEARLIDDLLDVTRIARGKIELHRQRVQFCTVVSQAVEVCKADIEARNLHFGVDMGPTAPYWIDADVPRLQQVFWNLLKNAIKFTPNGGCVGIRCRPNRQYLVAEVNDSGIGIEPESLSRVFNAFEQEERSGARQFGGLGLGLAISKALVEMHGGKIEAHSEGRNKGATFRVRLPLSTAAGRREESTPVAARERAVRPLNILLVEDDGVTAKVMRTVLTADGHRVEMAGDVATALQMVESHRFDLLVSDLGLPDGSGHDLLRELRRRGHAFPGVALSGYGQEVDIQRSREAGFSSHLTKPASREAMVDAIASAIVEGTHKIETS